MQSNQPEQTTLVAPSQMPSSTCPPQNDAEALPVVEYLEGELILYCTQIHDGCIWPASLLHKQVNAVTDSNSG